MSLYCEIGLRPADGRSLTCPFPSCTHPSTTASTCFFTVSLSSRGTFLSPYFFWWWPTSSAPFSSPIPGEKNNSALVFVLAVVFISYLTTGYVYGIAASIVGAFCINYFLMFPYSAFSLSISGYPVAMLSMVAISCIVCNPYRPGQAAGAGRRPPGEEHQSAV